jgi:ABC-type branched-subunit amino acid transport system ATPase component
VSAASLELAGVTVRFGGLTALDDVSLSVPPAAIVGLIGPNGAGKTTLFDSVAGVVSPASGRVELFGTDVTGWPPHRRARLGVARTFQRLELFGSLTVLENLVMAAESRTGGGGLLTDLLALPPTVEGRAGAEQRARDMLDTLAIREYEHSLAADLPLGVSRLVELGRALCTDPKLLLLDEPSSGLRIDESRRLAETLRRLKADAGMSILVVEHDMSFVLGLCERVTVLDFGRVLAEGPPDEIRADPVVQAAYLGDELEAPAKKAAAKKRAPATKKAPAKKKASAKKVTRARAARG